MIARQFADVARADRKPVADAPPDLEAPLRAYLEALAAEVAAWPEYLNTGRRPARDRWFSANEAACTASRALAAAWPDLRVRYRLDGRVVARVKQSNGVDTKHKFEVEEEQETGAG